uniref:plasmid replication initiation protein n=1 Tax=Lentilactobacillus sp. TaxID=2767931 RepID=UPI00345EA08F
MHFNPKTGKNEPNRLYLAELDMRSTDVYLRGEYGQKEPQTLATSESLKNRPSRETVETLATSESLKNRPSRKSVDDTPQTLATSESLKNRHDLDKELKARDTNRYNIDTAELDFFTENYSKAEIQKQNQDLIEQAYKFLTNDEAGIPFEPETVKLISLWTNNPKQVRKFIGIILNARKAVQEEHNISFILDDEPELQAKITQTIRRYFNALRSDDKKIRNQENYLYITMKNMFENYGSARQQREYRAEHPTKKDREEAFINGLKGGLPESIRNAENYK